jgi:glutamate/tyrosine decarboxylase-like PLP-dependent enzyme
MIGFDSQACGHFTSGGTLANFEALWRTIVKLDRRLALYLHALEKKVKVNLMEVLLSKKELPNVEYLEKYSLLSLGPWSFGEVYSKISGEKFRGPVVLIPGNKHFSWEKAVSIMGLGLDSFWSIRLDENGHLDVDHLRELIEKALAEKRPITMIVSVCGTTELGEVDPINRVSDLLNNYKTNRGFYFWHHVDAAYGGYYASLLHNSDSNHLLGKNVILALKALSTVQSVTLDPHKLGYIPYSCGAFLACDAEHYQFRGFRAEYLIGKNRSRWPFTIEGSRSGASST